MNAVAERKPITILREDRPPWEHSAYWICRLAEQWIARWDAIYPVLAEMEAKDAKVIDRERDAKSWKLGMRH